VFSDQQQFILIRWLRPMTKLGSLGWIPEITQAKFQQREFGVFSTQRSYVSDV
jgi:hypothetical protein